MINQILIRSGTASIEVCHWNILRF